ncbi:hypothetical protein MKW92_001009 [Papaver armeniacum]|nr:hypothetical protein MKW92_001009 [Papaver armeniacum]
MNHCRKMKAGFQKILNTSSSTCYSNPNPNFFNSSKTLSSKTLFFTPSSSSSSILRRGGLNTKSSQIHTVVSAMSSSSYKPEQARVPPATPVPSPPITKIALCQLSVTEDKETNIAHARKAIQEAAEKGDKLVLLPEIWNSPYSNDSFPVYAEDIDAGGDASPSTAMLSEVARSLKITIVGGSIPERCGKPSVQCMLCLWQRWNTEGKTQKDVGRIGIGICYDIRFLELATIYASEVLFCAHLLCYPGAFNMTTVVNLYFLPDQQLYVATCSPARDAGAGYTAWGHSTLVGPFGEVLATTEHDEAIVISEIDYSVMVLRR